MKTVILKPNGVGRYDDASPFIITDNQLQLKIELPAVYGEFYFVGVLGEVKIKKLIPTGSALTLCDLTAGELCAEVKHYLKGELIKTYRIEPLLLKEVDSTLTAEPLFDELVSRVEKLEKSIESLKISEKQRTEWAKSVEGKIKALCLFAFTDYQQNVYLDGKDLNDFIKRFGFEFTEKEIEFLKEKKNEN